MTRLKNQRKDYKWNGKLNDTLPFEEAANLVFNLIQKDMYDVACDILKEYKFFLAGIREHFNSTWNVYAYIESETAYEIDICDLAQVYQIIEEKTTNKTMSEDIYIKFVSLMRDCYSSMKRLYTNKEKKYPKKIDRYKISLSPYIVRYVRNNNIDIRLGRIIKCLSRSL